MAAVFTIRFAGGGIRPETVAAHELAELITAAEQTVMNLVSANVHEPGQNELIVGLIQVQDQSLGLAFSANYPEIVEPAFHQLTAAISQSDFSKLPSRSAVGLQTIAAFNARRHCIAEIWDTGWTRSATPVAIMDEGLLARLPDRPQLSGETVLYGRLERVGGVEPKVRIRVSPKESVSCQISAELAKQIGSKLYGEIGVRGTGTWDATDLALLYFHVDQILEFEPGATATAFTELRAAVDGAYDNINVDEFMASLRDGTSG